MGFRALTAAFQERIDDFQNRTIDEDMVYEIEEILEEYCCTLEETYGLGLSFTVEVSEEDGRLRYTVEPDSPLDDMLLAEISTNEACVSRATMRIQ